MRRTFISLLTLGLTSLVTAQAFAQSASTSPMATERRAAAGFNKDNIVVGAKVGVSNVQNLGDLVFAYGASGDYVLDPNFLVGATVDYWSRSSTGLASTRVQINDFTVGANTKFLFSNVGSSSLRPFALAGLAVHRFSINTSEEVNTARPEIEKYKKVDNDVAGELGIDLGGGVLYRIQESLDLNGEVRYRKLTNTTVALDQLAFSGGLAYRL